MSKICFRKQRFVKLKVFLCIICILMAIFELRFAADLMKIESSNYRSVNAENYDTIKADEYVQGNISQEEAVMTFEKEHAQYIVVLTSGNKLLLIGATDLGSSFSYNRMSQFIHQGESIYSFKGIVKKVNEPVLVDLQLNMTMKQSEKLKGKDVLNLMISAVDSDEDSAEHSSVTYVIASIVGAILFLALAVLLVWKSFNNLIYGYLVANGKIEPELKVKKEDILFEKDGNYIGSDNDSDSFYVNTDFNVWTAASGDYHFLRDEQKGAAPSDGQTPPENSDGDIPPDDPGQFFYQSGINEEGNFYVEENNQSRTDSDGNDLLHY